jgi:integration host factor subunit beta
VTKSHLVEQLAATTEVSKQEAERIVDTLLAAVVKALQSGERLDIRGFGSFKVRDQAARQARNPRTGEMVAVPAKKVAVFKPSKELGTLLNVEARTTGME